MLNPHLIAAGVLAATGLIAFAFRKQISTKIHDFVGSWAWFIGSVMADSFENRMNEIAEEMEEEMNGIGPDSDDSDQRPN